MSENLGLLAYQFLYAPLCNHVIEVVSFNGHDNYGKPVLDPSTARQYKCLLQMNEETAQSTPGATDDFPYMAYVLSVPIGQGDAVPIRAEEQVTVISPAYWASDTPRLLGKINTYFDQYGNNFVMVFTFK
jgi:hypothetical protein